MKKENEIKRKTIWKEEKQEKEGQSRIGPSHGRKWSLVGSLWNTVWIYLSFLSEPRTQAYITCCKSLFWLNMDT